MTDKPSQERETCVMAKWYENANDASFKPVPGGFVFQSPNPWLFGRPRYYVVNDEQKAAIMPILRRWRFVMIAMAIVMVPLMIGVMLVLQVRLHYSALVSIAVGSAVVLIPVLSMPHLYLMHGLAPLVGGLPRSDEGFSWRDQFERTAVAAPKAMLIVGGAGGVLMIVGGLIGLIDTIMDGRTGVQLMSAVSTMILGGLMAAYFFGLVRLKAKLTQTPR
jgi:hypothetical protein